MLSSGQEFKCWSQKAGVEKMSNLFLRGSVGLEGKMNDETNDFPDTSGP